jgi:hypothetical protein
MTTKSGEKPGYRAQGKARAANKKNNFAINAEQMEYERRKLLEQMSSKMSPNKNSLTTWRQLLQQKNQNTLTKKETKKNQVNPHIITRGRGSVILSCTHGPRGINKTQTRLHDIC